MKLDLLFVLCFGIICCLSVAFAGSTNDGEDDGGLSGRGRKTDFHECTGQYLKNKGILASNVPTGNSSPTMCRVLLQGIISAAREDFENRANEELPNELVCLMSEYDKGGITDFVLKVAFYHTYDSLTADERKSQFANMKTEGDQLRNTLATACRIEVDKFEKFLSRVFSPSRKTGKRLESASNSETSETKLN